MDSLTDIGHARLACLALSLLMLPFSMGFWLVVPYIKSLTWRTLLGYPLGLFPPVLILVQIFTFREIANIEGRVIDPVLILIVIAQSAVSLVIGHYRDRLRVLLRLQK